MIIDYPADHDEVRKFRERIYTEDLNLDVDLIKEFDIKKHSTYNKFAYWYSDQKFLTNGFDRVLLHYYNNLPVGMVGGTYFNKNLYRGVQGYYILKSARQIPGMNTLHFRHDGFFDWQINRAKDLGCKAVFISFDLFDKRHEIMYQAMKNDVVGPGHMPNSERKYTSIDLIYPDEFYVIKNIKQKVCYYPLTSDIDFNNLYRV